MLAEANAMWRRGPLRAFLDDQDSLDGRANPGASGREGLWLFNKSQRRVEQRAIESQPVRLSANSLRPDAGQMTAGAG
jgi:hypothetical protein